MDWLNCNTCCRQPDEKEMIFMLSSCGHIFCGFCLKKAGENAKTKCIFCTSDCQLIQLSSKMKPDAEMFFLEPSQLIKRHFGQINKLLSFQKEHRNRLITFYRKVMTKYSQIEKKFVEMEKNHSMMGKKLKEEMTKNETLTQELNGLKRSLEEKERVLEATTASSSTTFRSNFNPVLMPHDSEGSGNGHLLKRMSPYMQLTRSSHNPNHRQVLSSPMEVGHNPPTRQLGGGYEGIKQTNQGTPMHGQQMVPNCNPMTLHQKYTSSPHQGRMKSPHEYPKRVLHPQGTMQRSPMYPPKSPGRITLVKTSRGAVVPSRGYPTMSPSQEKCSSNLGMLVQNQCRNINAWPNVGGGFNKHLTSPMQQLNIYRQESSTPSGANGCQLFTPRTMRAVFQSPVNH